MRLLELTGERIRLCTFQTDIPRYAILSHTWGEDESEITFADIEDGWVPIMTGLKSAGYRKLIFCGKQAQCDGFRWFWVDSCCIDQQNERELQESIASMFRWYQYAAKCYVYLSDVSFSQPGDRYNLPRWEYMFQSSRWFTRGWTLQELLAPRMVEFFSAQGEWLGDKQCLEEQLHRITKIPVEALRGKPLQIFPVEERMKWTGGRTTRREEDMAYCLQGIFGVYLSLIYGEGSHAFIRLEQAIDAYRKCESPCALQTAKLTS
jgi:hypothetical protein